MNLDTPTYTDPESLAVRLYPRLSSISRYTLVVQLVKAELEVQRLRDALANRSEVVDVADWLRREAAG